MLVKYDFLPQLIKRYKNEKPKLRFPNSPHISKACRQDYCAISRRVAEIAIYLYINLVTFFFWQSQMLTSVFFFFFNKELTDENMEPHKII